METTDTVVERGSSNVVADLGVPDADVHLVKAEIVSRIDAIVRQRGIAQTEAARLLGLSQPDVSTCCAATSTSTRSGASSSS